MQVGEVRNPAGLDGEKRPYTDAIQWMSTQKLPEHLRVAMNVRFRIQVFSALKGQPEMEKLKVELPEDIPDLYPEKITWAEANAMRQHLAAVLEGDIGASVEIREAVEGRATTRVEFVSQNDKLEELLGAFRNASRTPRLKPPIDVIPDLPSNGTPQVILEGPMETASNTPERDCWRAMIARCRLPWHQGYSHSGTRGITVCERWNSFEAFFADMGPRPPGMTGKIATYSIERIDINGNTNGNCKWATRKEQQSNTRRVNGSRAADGPSRPRRPRFPTVISLKVPESDFKEVAVARLVQAAFQHGFGMLATSPIFDWLQLPLNYGDRVYEFAFRELELDRRINILDGSVRSGKTWALIPKILWASDAASKVRGWRIMFGQTKETVYSNVLKDLFDIIGDRYYSYSHHSGHLRIFDTEWRVLGARDEGSEKFLRGATVGIAVGDELVLTPEGFFKMMLTRMSPKGARLYATTNPDNPMHWLNTEYLTNPQVLEKDLYHLHMTMDDNPNLEEEFKESQRRLFKGMFFNRFILGLWVMAEGSIWGDAWDDSLLYCDPDCADTRELDGSPHTHNYVPITLKNAGGFADHWYSNDYGTDHPHVYHEFWDDGDVVWLDREWVWDSKERRLQLTDGQYGDELLKFMGPNRGAQVIIPPEALSFRAECMQRGCWVTNAKNEVIEGIQTVAGMMCARKLRINRKCIRTRRAIVSYVWDPNGAKRGLEQPLKQNDDEADSLRYGLHTKIQKWRYAVQKVAA